MLDSIQLFTISELEGRWPNRIYFNVLPGSVLYHEGTSEAYTDWLYDAVQEDEQVIEEMTRIIDAVRAREKLVRLVVTDRFNDFRGNTVIKLVKQIIGQGQS